MVSNQERVIMALYSKILIIIYFLLLFIGLWGEIRSWEDGTTIVQKTHDASKHHVTKVRN